MVLDWLGKPKVEADVTLLVTRKQYGQAIDVLRKSFAKRLPDVNQRLQFAALLVLARRGEEAVPVLLGVADEQARLGLSERALQTLDRIDTIQPGRPDVARRRAGLQAQAAERAECAEPVVLPEDEPFEEPRSEEGEPLALQSLEEPVVQEGAPAGASEPIDLDALPEDEPVLVDPDVSDPGAWAGALADASYGQSDDAARAIEDGDTNPFGYPVPDWNASSASPSPSEPPSGPVPPARTGVAELVRLLQELAGRGVRADGRVSLASALLSGLSRARLLTLVPGLRWQSFSAGDVILTEGEPGQSLFLIARGQVKVFVRSPHGRSFEVARLEEDDFFGEVSVISGRPRTASIVASAPCEVVEVRRDVLESLLQGRTQAQALLEEACVSRALSPAGSAVRALPKEAAGSRERAHAALAAHFGDTQWSLRMRLRLADLLLKAGNEGDAVAILTSVADALAAADSGEKALAVLQKIASIRRRHVEELCLAPLVKDRPPDPKAAERSPRSVAAPEHVFRDWLLHMVREATEEATGEDGKPLTLH